MEKTSTDQGQNKGSSPVGARPATEGFYFAQIPSYLLDAVISGVVPDSALRVYATIWRRYVFMGRIFPSWKTLGEDCGLNASSVRRVCGLLKEVGALTWGPRFNEAGQTSNEYALADHNPFVFTQGKVVTDERGAESAPRDGAKVLTSEQGGVLTNKQGGCSEMSTEKRDLSTKETELDNNPPTPREPVEETGSAGEGSDLLQQKDKDAATGGWPDPEDVDCGPDVPEWEDLAEEGQLTLPVAAEVLLHHAGLPVNDISTARVLKWFAPEDEDFLVPLLADSATMKPLPNMSLQILRGRVKFLRTKLHLDEPARTPARRGTA